MELIIESANFQPWIGSKYFKGGYNGKRILVLGESHYCENERSSEGRCSNGCFKQSMTDVCHNMTNEVITEFMRDYSWSDKDKHHLRCFFIFSRLVAGEAIGYEESKRFWDSVVFYNYIQYSQIGPKRAVDPSYWQPSETALKELLHKIHPDIILVWGKRLYQGLPDLYGYKEVDIIIEGHAQQVCNYSFEGRTIPAVWFYHPSSSVGHSWQKWHPFYIEALKYIS